jgi:hypothetical protein
MTADRSIPRHQLPAAIASYFTAHQHREAATAMTTFTTDAAVTDEGRTYRGHDEIADWLRNAASGYTYSMEFVGSTRSDNSHVDVVQHLEGDFPGGVADLHFRFTLDDGLISGLVIEP